MLRTIAATTSSTGLTVHAELDSGEYPTGVRISDEDIAALPITRHRFHGDWNYTFHPADHHPCPGFPRQRGRSAGGSDSLMPHDLRHPELTGMSRKQLGDLTDALVPGLEEHREQVRHAARGGPRRVARGTGRKPTLTPADQILVTILYLWKHALPELLGQLFNTTAMTISRAVKDVRPLLQAHGVTVPASTARFHTPDDIAAFLAPDETKIKPAC
ncbi:hypothetical protein GCM10010365_21210 [Streptomyces poonensis]|uniref:Transposase n=1 Tax=Streptomyces poonensis TaxID=68255 RepID=A0A918PDK7_9ACTN|nr:hypothetical protein [Streptomyces poonensis]GGZ01920.1 hypothetical protein GCM10010365_21210 [Streptomyces poonensis]GLJ93528.1 hypothetical protein GCM10017589_61420 [Streptomyces poonensis]